jgi:hypothetical protein
MQTIEHNSERLSYQRIETDPDEFANSNEAPVATPAATAQQTKPTRVPPPRSTRWIPQRKAEIVAAIRGGYMSFDEARERYELSIEEFVSWQIGIELSGLAGLRVNRVQQNRRRRGRSTDRSRTERE